MSTPDFLLTNELNSGLLINDVIDGMNDWVRVIDRDDNMLYLNKAMVEGIKSNPVGCKCYFAIGKSAPCEECVSRKAVFDGTSHEKEETIDGKIFSVISSPVRNKNGDIIAAVEVLRNITQIKQLQFKILEQNRMFQDDLSIAKKLQCSLLPKERTEGKIDFSFIYKPCETLGGDFFDIYSIDQDHVGVYIADVSGHGVPASLLTVFLKSTINKKIISPAEVLEKLYAEFNNSNFDYKLYITVFYAVINTKDYTLTYSNAGHNVAPIIYNKGRREVLRSSGIPISNWLKEPAYIDKSFQIVKGDRILLCTDGIIEINNKENSIFGEDRILNILSNDVKEPDATLNQIIDNACEFAQIKNFDKTSDDITIALLVIR